MALWLVRVYLFPLLSLIARTHIYPNKIKNIGVKDQTKIKTSNACGHTPLPRETEQSMQCAHEPWPKA